MVSEICFKITGKKGRKGAIGGVDSNHWNQVTGSQGFMLLFFRLLNVLNFPNKIVLSSGQKWNKHQQQQADTVFTKRLLSFNWGPGE